MKPCNWLASFSAVLAIPSKLSRRRQVTSRFPIACEVCEERVVLSAPNIIQIDGPTTVDEGVWVPVNVTFDCDDEDQTNTIQWSEDGGVTWLAPYDVYANGQYMLTSMFPGLDDGTVNWAVKITDSESLTTTASGSIGINNVAPTITLLSDPSGSTVHENQYVSFGFDVYDPAAGADPITVTIDWGAGPSSERYETIILNDPNDTSPSHHVSRMHQYCLASNSDQAVTIIATANDGDGGADTESSALSYDDVISDLFGQGDGSVDGVINFGMHAIVEAGGGGRTISDYQVDVNHDGIFDDGMFIDSFTWDPNNVVLDGVYGLPLLGNPSSAASFTGQFRITTSDGVYQDADLAITITVFSAGASSTVIKPVSPSAASVTIDAQTSLRHEATADYKFWVQSRDGNEAIESAGGIISLSAAEMANAYNTKTFFLQAGVDFRAEVTRTGAVFADSPYFIQYVKNRHFFTESGQTTVDVIDWHLDGSANDVPGHPLYYRTQAMFSGVSTMNDFLGTAIILRQESKSIDLYPMFEVHGRYDRTTGKREYKMIRSIADELSVNEAHYNQFARDEKWEWQFETYVAVNTIVGITPLGYLDWTVRIITTATGYTVQFIGAPAYVPGKNSLVWDL